MAEPTKDELLKKIAELEDQVEQQKESMKKLSSKGEGYLITTPNPMYDGQVYGIQFVNGQAFIRKGQRVDMFEHEPLKDSTIQKYGYSPAEAAAIREREKRPSSELAAERMRTEFGYRVEYYDADHLGDLQGQIDQRLSQRVQAEEMAAKLMEAEQITAPHYLSY